MKDGLCLTCKIIFIQHDCYDRKYCSRKCYFASLKESMKNNTRGFQKNIKVVHSRETTEKIRKANFGRKASKKARKKLSISHLGIVGGMKDKKHSDESKLKMSQSAKKTFSNGRISWQKGKKCPQLSGKNSHCWKGGITELYNMIRNSFENKQWRNEIYRRDNYTCQDCFKRGNNLEAHHKYRFSYILRDFLNEYNQFSPTEDKETLVRLSITYKPFWDIDNGETLCQSCHRKTFNKNESIRRR